MAQAVLGFEKKVGIKTNEFLRGTTLEPVESQTQQRLLHTGLPNQAEIQRLTEAMAENFAATQLIPAGGEADYDFTPGNHVATGHRVGEPLTEMDIEFLNGPIKERVVEAAVKGSVVEPQTGGSVSEGMEGASPRSNAGTIVKLETMLVDVSTNLNCGMSKLRDFVESFKIHVRTEIKDELKETKDYFFFRILLFIFPIFHFFAYFFAYSFLLNVLFPLTCLLFSFCCCFYFSKHDIFDLFLLFYFLFFLFVLSTLVFL